MCLPNLYNILYILDLIFLTSQFKLFAAQCPINVFEKKNISSIFHDKAVGLGFG